MTGSSPIAPSEVAVVGAGCAGLSLAVGLLERFPSMRVTLFDPRTEFADDRSWCFFDFGDHGLDGVVSHRWERLRVRGPGSEVMIDCGQRPYAHVRAGDFNRWALDRLDASGRAEVRLGESVERIEEDGACVRVVAADGVRASRFEMAFDGRPPASGGEWERSVSLVQAFVGHEVAFDEDRVKTGAATLMDFRVDQSRGLRFMYALPFDRRRALVESTFLVRPGEEDAVDAGAIASYCERVYGAAPARVERVERGRLPMTTAPLGPPSTERVWRIGTRAGVARASTGYAFDAIRRDTGRVMEALAAGRGRPAPPRPWWLTAMDRMLVSLLHHRPEVGPVLFERLLGSAPSDALIRFLSDRASVVDAGRIVWSMPKRQMTAHVARRPRSCLG